MVSLWVSVCPGLSLVCHVTLSNPCCAVICAVLCRAFTGSSASGAGFHDLLEVENLLESYFMMVDGTLAKLSGIGEYVDDTEDYINIELDYNRNRCVAPCGPLPLALTLTLTLIGQC